MGHPNRDPEDGIRSKDNNVVAMIIPHQITIIILQAVKITVTITTMTITATTAEETTVTMETVYMEVKAAVGEGTTASAVEAVVVVEAATMTKAPIECPAILQS